MLSVALCSFNGAPFIMGQMKSILNQTVKVDEIVVCDDGSTDGTIETIESLRETTDIEIRVYHNEARLGINANFQKAVDLCKGDIIFLADQDDVWHPDKVDLIVRYFETHPDKQVVFTDGDLIDESGLRTSENSLWDYVGMTGRAQSYIGQGFGIELFAGANRATGATMAIRRSFAYLQSFSAFANEVVLHDYAIALLALGENSLGFLPAHTIDYRIHSGQQMGIRDYFGHPMDDDLCHTNHDTVEVESLGYPEPVASRIGFLIKRDRNRHKALGLFGILKSYCLYRPLYGDKGSHFALMDMRQWVHNQWHRLFLTHK